MDIRNVAGKPETKLLVVIVLILGVICSAHFFWNSSSGYLEARARRHAVIDELEVLERQKEQMRRHGPVWDKVKSFLDQATALGLTENQWGVYHVAVDEPTTFEKAALLLDQTAPYGSYYFKPSMLHIKKNLLASNEESGEPGEIEGDLLLKLNGSFIVRTK